METYSKTLTLNPHVIGVAPVTSLVSSKGFRPLFSTSSKRGQNPL